MPDFSSVRVTVLEGGLYTTIQDLGRTTGRAYGVPPGGVMDRAAHCAANRLVQNRPTAATLEITRQGPRLQFEQPALIALTGADLPLYLNDRAMPGWTSLFVRAGQLLHFGPIRGGRAAYLSIHGGWEAPLLMSSRATYVRAAFGGYRGEGRPLAAGDVLTTAADFGRPLPQLSQAAGQLFPRAERPPYNFSEAAIALVPGPFQENFSPETYNVLYNSVYTLTQEADRMGFRLEGPPLAHLRPDLAEIAACGTVFGAVQVPPNGQPIVLMADHQVTGGYPLIGVVAEASLPLLAQLWPGAEVRFYPAPPVQ